MAGSYDVVFATNVLHATRNMGNTLAHSKASFPVLLTLPSVFVIGPVSGYLSCC